MSLEDLQHAFFNRITLPASKPQSIVREGGSLSPEDRINIYYDAYRFRLINALSDTYPAVHTLLGDDEFEKLGRKYIDAHPPEHFSIRYFGDRLSEFVISYALTQNPTLIAEMAGFEWALRHAFDAKDENMLTLDDLQRSEIQDWSKVIFHIPQSLVCLDLFWNVPALWKAVEQNGSPVQECCDEFASHWIIWRPDLETFFRSFNEKEYTAFQLLVEKNSFGDMCEKISLLDDNPAQLMAQFLSNWIGEGLIHSFEN